MSHKQTQQMWDNSFFLNFLNHHQLHPVPAREAAPPPVPPGPADCGAACRGQLREKLGAVPEAFCCSLDGRHGLCFTMGILE